MLVPQPREERRIDLVAAAGTEAVLGSGCCVRRHRGRRQGSLFEGRGIESPGEALSVSLLLNNPLLRVKNQLSYLCRRCSRTNESVLLQGSIGLCLLSQTLERVGGPAKGVPHFE
jgi:hypothetical protein